MSIFNRKKMDNSSSANPDVEFYNQVIETLHKQFVEKGYLKKDIIVIPEVFEKGKKSVLEILQEEDLKMHCRTPDYYYYVLSIVSFSHGMLYADFWHKDYDQFNKTFDKYSYDDSSDLFAEEFLEEFYGLEKFKRKELFSDIFEEWKKLILPYMNNRKARDYIFASFNAVYNLGVCFVMEKYGEM